MHDEEFEIAGVHIVRDGRNVIWSATERFNQKAMRATWIAQGEAAAVRSGELVAELRQLVASVNAVHLVGQVAAWALAGVSDVDDAGERFGKEAQVEFLGALAVESGSLLGDLAGPDDVLRAREILDELFEAEKARILGEEVAAGSDPDDILGEVRFWLRMESLLDRMQGYGVHLGLILERVFEPIRETCVSTLGFSPADIPKLVGAHFIARQEHFEERIEAARSVPTSELSGLSAPQDVVLLAWVMFTFADPRGDVDVDQLGQQAGVPKDQAAALLDALTSEWGQPTSTLRPGMSNSFRRKPVLRGVDGRYEWALVWSPAHEALPWFKEMVDSRQLPELAKSYSEARAAATEDLVVDTLVRIFGEEAALPNFEYPIGSGNWAEADVVVRLPGHALAVECKSGALKEGYRLGDVDHVSFALHDLVENPFTQSERAARFLTQALGKFRLKGSAVKHEWIGVPSVTRIAVTLERIDPLVLVAARARFPDAAGTGTWVVCLADLLMVAEILDDKHTFFGYARLRAELAANPAVAVISEADVLGAFLHDRLRLLRQNAKTGANTIAMLNHHAHRLNAWYTGMAVGQAVTKPTARLPKRAVQRLEQLWAAGDPTWAHATEAAVAGPT